MSWRTVVIQNHCKLDLKLNQMVVRGEKVTKVNLSEIDILMIENTAVSITACLMSELVSRKIKVIFCDAKRNPQFELSPYYGCHDGSGKLREQLAWALETKELVWQAIVKEKIHKQAELMSEQGLERSKLLLEYEQSVLPGDITNREGHAAKVYFNDIFGDDFSRGDEDEFINAALNYGYAILLSTFNREIISNGYLTQLGIFHKNIFNSFNLGSDLMEPFRILVDREVLHMKIEDEFGPEEKKQVLSILKTQVVIQNQKFYLTDAIAIYCKGIFTALNTEDLSAFQSFSFCK